MFLVLIYFGPPWLYFIGSIKENCVKYNGMASNIKVLPISFIQGIGDVDLDSKF